MSEQDKQFEEWLATKPEIIQQIGKKYPPYLKYKIKERAPYSISSAGSIVDLYSYLENGNVMVVVLAKYKTQNAIEHEKHLGEKYKHSDEAIKEFHGKDVLVEIDPQWLTPLNETSKN